MKNSKEPLRINCDHRVRTYVFINGRAGGGWLCCACIGERVARGEVVTVACCAEEIAPVVQRLADIRQEKNRLRVDQLIGGESA